MKKIMKMLGLSIAIIACMSMAFSPVFMAENSYATDDSTGGVSSEEVLMTDELYDRIDGKNIEELQNDEELAEFLDDPMFLRYFDVDENGNVTKKVVDTDEVDNFIAEMDANAEGINDDQIVEMNTDMSCMGCGVSGLGKAKTPSKYSSYGRYNCIDISYWQGKVSAANWAKIKAAGVTHVIQRVGYSALKTGAHNSDSTFANNINGAYNAGIKCGVYYYSTAKTAAEAKSEAQYTIKLLSNYKSKITMPVAYDYETGGRLTASVMKKYGTASCVAFCDTIKAAGYTPMVYANYSTLTNYLSYSTLQSKYPIWLANYTSSGSATTYPGNYWMWQYSSSGKINGLSGSIDMNYMFDNQQGGANVAANTGTVTTTPTVTAVSYYARVKSRVNYRTGPSTKYKKKGSYSKNKIVTAVGTSGSWTKLSNGYYVSSKWLSKCSAYKAKTTTGVNYRSGAGTKYKKKGTYSTGTTVTVLYTTGQWARLSNGYYMYKKYLQKI